MHHYREKTEILKKTGIPARSLINFHMCIIESILTSLVWKLLCPGPQLFAVGGQDSLDNLRNSLLLN
ncbi:hypothetical protein NFI96_022727 [Prochilodus magdalenae]|nr:hypothetical protein NFI96_022727 [Prochilodus magdalenae]